MLMQLGLKNRSALDKVAAAMKAYFQHIIAFGLVILGILVVYGHDLQIVFNEALQNQALSHILLIPILAGILAYLKRDVVKASLALQKPKSGGVVEYADELVGVALCVSAFLVYWYGSFTFYPLEVHLLSLPIFLVGMTLVLFNLDTVKALIYPILFLFFLVPPPSDFLYNVGGTLASISTRASFTLLEAMHLPVTLSTSLGPPTISLSGVPYEVDLACSGIYSLMAFAAFAVFIAVIASASLPRKAVLAVTGFVTFAGLNIIRITTIISIAEWLGNDIAMNFFHAVEGYVLIFVGMILTLAIAERLLGVRFFPASRATQPCPRCKTSFGVFCENCGKYLKKPLWNPSQKFWAKLFLIIIGCAAVTFIVNAPTFAVVQGPTGVASIANWENATNVFPQISNFSLQFLYRDTAYEQLAGQDASLFYCYAPGSNSLSTATADSAQLSAEGQPPLPTNSSQLPVYVDVGVSSSISNLHNWEVCLISWQAANGQAPLVSTLDSRDITLLPEVPLVAHYLTFSGSDPTNYTQVTLYWYEQAPFNTGVTVQEKYVRISLIIWVGTENNTAIPQSMYQPLENELFTIGQIVAASWEPLQSQSLVSMGIPALQALLLAAAAIIVVTKTAQYTNEGRNRDNNTRIFNSYGTKEEKTTLQTIQELTQKTKAIHTEDIGKAIQEKTGKPQEPTELQDTLNRLERNGLIKKTVTVTDNKPEQTWKTWPPTEQHPRSE